MSLTRPTVFATDVDQANHQMNFILEMIDSEGSPNTWLLSNRAFDLTDGHVYDVALAIDSISHESNHYQISSEPAQVAVRASNQNFTTTVALGAKSLSFYFELTQLNTANIYLATQNAASLSDCLKVFQGKLVGDPSFNDSELVFELLDITAFDTIDVPHEKISDDFAASPAAILGRRYPLCWGLLKHADNFRNGPLALAEQIDDVNWTCANEILNDTNKLWVHHAAFGDFCEVIEPAATTLAASVVATDTTARLASRGKFVRGDLLVFAIDTADEEILEISGFEAVLNVVFTTGFVNAHSTGVDVRRAYHSTDYLGRTSVRLMIETGNVFEENTRFRLDFFRLKGYVRSSHRSIAKRVAFHRDNQTYVNAASNSGQTTLNVDNTDGLKPGMDIDIDPDGGGGGSETKTIARIKDETTIFLTANLTFTHSSTNADVVIPVTFEDEDDISDFDRCRDGLDDTFAVAKVAENIAGTRHANLNVSFDDIDNVRGNITNKVGFITDYGTFVFVTAAPSVATITRFLRLQSGRVGGFTNANYRVRLQTTTLGTHEEISHFAGENNLLLLSELGKHTATSVGSNSSGNQFFVLPSIDVKGFNHGDKITIDKGNANEEAHEITDIDDNGTLHLVNTLANTHASGVIVTNEGSIGVFWALGTGDENSGYGLNINMFLTSADALNIGDDMMRVFDIGLYFEFLSHTKPYASSVLITRQVTYRDTRDDIPDKGNRAGIG